jgi:hypothetical protein
LLGTVEAADEADAIKKGRGGIQDAGQQVDCGKAMTDGNCRFSLCTMRSTLPPRVRGTDETDLTSVVAAWPDPGSAAIVAASSHRVCGFDFALLISSCLAPSRGSRGRQCDGERVAAQDHQGNQPPDSPLGIGIDAQQLGHVPDRRRPVSICRPLAAAPECRPLRFAHWQGPHRALRWPSIAESAVLVLRIASPPGTRV